MCVSKSSLFLSADPIPKLQSLWATFLERWRAGEEAGHYAIPQMLTLPVSAPNGGNKQTKRAAKKSTHKRRRAARICRGRPDMQRLVQRDCQWQERRRRRMSLHNRHPFCGQGGGLNNPIWPVVCLVVYELL